MDEINEAIGKRRIGRYELGDLLLLEPEKPKVREALLLKHCTLVRIDKIHTRVTVQSEMLRYNLGFGEIIGMAG